MVQYLTLGFQLLILAVLAGLNVSLYRARRNTNETNKLIAQTQDIIWTYRQDVDWLTARVDAQEQRIDLLERRLAAMARPSDVGGG